MVKLYAVRLKNTRRKTAGRIPAGKEMRKNMDETRVFAYNIRQQRKPNIGEEDREDASSGL